MTDTSLERDAIQQLTGAGIASSSREAVTMVAYVQAHFPEADWGSALGSIVARRLRNEPLERIIGRVRFRQVELLVGPGVFIPQPETSSVVDWAVRRLADMIEAGIPHPMCADLCCGSGTIALSIAAEVAAAHVHAVELDPGAATWAERNVGHNGLDVRVHCADAVDALRQFDRRLNMVVSNPPYVADPELAFVDAGVRDHDPTIALLAGPDGLDLIRAVESAARRLLVPGGWVVVEHSDRQGSSAPAVFDDRAVWRDVRDHRDHADRPRFVTAQRV